jgi:predicted PurR-regulated permease PerM
VALDRRTALGGLFVLLVLVAAAILVDVLATVFFAVTVAYLLAPLRDRLHERGLSQWWASVVASVSAFVGTVVVFTPLVVVLALRSETLLALIASIPESATVELLGFTYVVTFEAALAVAQGILADVARSFAAAAPVLLVKLTLFGLVVFALLVRERATFRALLGVVPPAYRDTAKALNRRTRETLFAIYVLQAATALGTFVIALPVFFLLGYDVPITLATVAAVLQFLPIVGPSILLAALGAYHLLVGEALQAALVVLVGGFFVAWLPDILIRPRLARETANLPGSLYFVGFIGGLLSLGPIGVIAGPLVIALVVEAAGLLSAEMNAVTVDEERTSEGRPTAEESERDDPGDGSTAGGPTRDDPDRETWDEPPGPGRDTWDERGPDAGPGVDDGSDDPA